MNLTSPLRRLARPLALGVAALGLTLSACDTAPSAPPTASPSSLPDGVVDPAAVGSGQTGDPALTTATAYRVGGPSAQATNRKLARVAKAVARVLADDEVRAYVHGRALQRFDGETNVLWKALDTAPDAPEGFGAESGSAFSSLLAERAAQVLGPDLPSPAALNASVEAASRALGGPMHLLWINADDVGPGEAPLVTFTPVGMDPDEIQRILAYDADGDEHVVDDRVAAQRPVVALSYNERVRLEDVDAVTAHINGARSQAVLDEYSFMSNCDEPDREMLDTPSCGGGGGGPSSYRAGSPDPVVPGQVRLEHIRLPHDYEGFTMGGPEIRVQITSYNAAQDTTNAISVHDIWESRHIEDEWADGNKIFLDDNLMPWNVENNPTLSMQWTEVDDFSDLIYVTDVLVGEDAIFKLPSWAETGVKALRYFFKKADEDENLNKADVNHETDIRMLWDLGKIEFEVTRNPTS